MDTRIADQPAFRLIGTRLACRSFITAPIRTSKRISPPCPEWSTRASRH